MKYLIMMFLLVGCMEYTEEYSEWRAKSCITSFQYFIYVGSSPVAQYKTVCSGEFTGKKYKGESQ